MTRLIAIGFLLACLFGCGAAMGNPKARLVIEQDKLPQRGNSIEQITAWLGSPNRIAPGADGHPEHVEYQYIYFQVLLRHPGLIWIPLFGLAFTQQDMAYWQLDVVFDEHGRVVDAYKSEIVG